MSLKTCGTLVENWLQRFSINLFFHIPFTISRRRTLCFVADGKNFFFRPTHASNHVGTVEV